MASIVTQREASRRRQGLKFCYLCGDDLSDQDETSREHIVPRAVLGTHPSTSAWALVLDVHERCERLTKREADAHFALWQRLFLPVEERAAKALEAIDQIITGTSPASPDARQALELAGARLAADVASAAVLGSAADLSEMANAAVDRYLRVLGAAGGISTRDMSRARTQVAAFLDPREHLNMGHYRNTPFKVVADVAAEKELLPLDGFVEVMGAVWTWVRGLHTAIYGSFLPDSTPHVVLSPLPILSGTTSPRPFPGQHVHQRVLGTLAVADRARKLDRLKCWGDQCDFRCVWVQDPNRGAFARGVWRLEVPGPKGTCSWWGWYDLPAPPEGSERLNACDFEIGAKSPP